MRTIILLVLLCFVGLAAFARFLDPDFPLSLTPAEFATFLSSAIGSAGFIFLVYTTHLQRQQTRDQATALAEQLETQKKMNDLLLSQAKATERSVVEQNSQAQSLKQSLEQHARQAEALTKSVEAQTEQTKIMRDNLFRDEELSKLNLIDRWSSNYAKRILQSASLLTISTAKGTQKYFLFGDQDSLFAAAQKGDELLLDLVRTNIRNELQKLREIGNAEWNQKDIERCKKRLEVLTDATVGLASKLEKIGNEEALYKKYSLYLDANAKFFADAIGLCEKLTRSGEV